MFDCLQLGAIGLATHHVFVCYIVLAGAPSLPPNPSVWWPCGRFRTPTSSALADPTWTTPDFWFRGPGVDAVDSLTVHVHSGGSDPRDPTGHLLGSADVAVVELWGREGQIKEAWYDLKQGDAVVGQVRLCVQVRS